jgi:hypothetical protein
MINLKGWRTLLFNLLLVIGPPALYYLANIDWANYLNPVWAPVVVGAFGVILRVVTTSPVTKK